MTLLLSIEDVARALSLSERTVKRLVAAGQIPSVSIGSARHVPRDDLERFVEELRADGNRSPAAGAP